MLYRKPTQLRPAPFVMLFQSLEIVVEYSRMADQTHLFRRCYFARSDDRATPRADNIKCRLEVFEFVALRIYVSAHTSRIHKLRSSFPVTSRPQ